MIDIRVGFAQRVANRCLNRKWCLFAVGLKSDKKHMKNIIKVWESWENRKVTSKSQLKYDGKNCLSVDFSLNGLKYNIRHISPLKSKPLKRTLLVCSESAQHRDFSSVLMSEFKICPKEPYNTSRLTNLIKKYNSWQNWFVSCI